MARIPEAEIERLKREIALERLVEARGLVLKRKGADLVGRCPFGTHADSEPSFVVTPAKNLWHCFGCQQGGSVIDWVMRVEGVSFRHAVELMRDDNASPATAAEILPAGPHSGTTRAGLGVKRSRVQKLETLLDRQADDRQLLQQVISYYHETLKESPEALRYLERRGLRSEAAIARFKLGYANRTLGYLLLQSGCNAPQTAHKVEEQVAPQIATPAQQSTEGATESMPKGLFDQHARGMEAWLRFQADGRYRMARRDDFQIPEAVMKENLNDPFFTNKFAYVAGDFNRDGHLLDLAFIVVDTTTTRGERFGLVVFNAPADEGLPSVHWVFKDLDLSKSVLSAATDVMSLTEYHEDGTQQVCNVRWNKKRAEYSCEKSR